MDSIDIATLAQALGVSRRTLAAIADQGVIKPLPSAWRKRRCFDRTAAVLAGIIIALHRLGVSIPHGNAMGAAWERKNYQPDKAEVFRFNGRLFAAVEAGDSVIGADLARIQKRIDQAFKSGRSEDEHG